jgi:hypothetical protein
VSKRWVRLLNTAQDTATIFKCKSIAYISENNSYRGLNNLQIWSNPYRLLFQGKYMVRVCGNSPERIKIVDLNDIIYYRQQKEYTDQEFENSRDLKKEIDKGRITILERHQAIRMQSYSEPVAIKQVIPTSINQEDIKNAISEVLSGFSRPEINISEIKKIVSDAVRQLDPQEIKRMVAEVLAEHRTETGIPDMTTALLSMIPMIADVVRQEVAKIQVVSPRMGIPRVVPEKIFSECMGPEFIPNISTEGMKSNVKGEERLASGGDVAGSLEALKRLQKKSG